MTWPICKVFGLTVGFAASKAATVTLNVAAMVVKVSPDFTVYDAPEVDGVGVGVTGAGTLDGMMIEAPT